MTPKFMNEKAELPQTPSSKYLVIVILFSKTKIDVDLNVLRSGLQGIPQKIHYIDLGPEDKFTFANRILA